MNEQKFYKNLFAFLAICVAWSIADTFFGYTSNITDVILIAFFLVWNMNQCAKRKAGEADKEG